MSDDQPVVGFVGLGAMGWPMAHNLHAAGFPLVVRDVSPDAEDRFAAEHDATMKATTPNDFRSVAILLTMLPDGGIVADAVLGWGIAAAASPGTIKDTRIAASIAAAAGIDAPVIALASERWAAAVTELGPAVDQSRAHQAWTGVKLSRELWQYRPRGRTGRAGSAG